MRDTFLRVALRAVALRVNRLRVAFLRVTFFRDAAARDAVRRATPFLRETFFRVAPLRDATRAMTFLTVFFLADRLTFFFITVLFTPREEYVHGIRNKRNGVPLRNAQLQRNTALEVGSTDEYARTE
ncbi:MAG: hypothetical protein F4198_13625 [Acidobacteria bacterium]|nr:hypothetical protein [Acidobacteriota bacterium]